MGWRFQRTPRLAAIELPSDFMGLTEWGSLCKEHPAEIG
jgi:hypothetical protein